MPGSRETFPARYEFRVGERLPARSATWFDGMTISLDERWDDRFAVQTVIRGTVRDQAALFGLVGRIRDLGLTLLSIRRLEEGEEEE